MLRPRTTRHEPESGRQGDAAAGTTNTTGAFQVVDYVAEAVVVDAEHVAQLKARQGAPCPAHGEQDAIVQGWRRDGCRGGGTAGGWRRRGEFQVRGRAVVARDETQLEGVEGWSGAMLEGEAEAFAVRTVPG